MPEKKETPNIVKVATPSKRVRLSAEVIESHRLEHLRRVAGPAKTLRGGK